MPNKIITGGELRAIHDALCLMTDEIEAINESRLDYVFTSGVGEACDEALIIVEAIMSNKDKEVEIEYD